MSFLELKNVTKSYRSGNGNVPILESIDLEIERGEFVAIVGFSGAGKSTLISLIAA